MVSPLQIRRLMAAAFVLGLALAPAVNALLP
ncbi:hypothetical protein Mnod_6806 [Methylobacterium nodulans ORS 2060]|uniref:Uncharacterized protein n=1 Tax=Methylobacterium nodulans (strain LMG 21967 / CNCM I-2342 / ORS 2060) TaxID=460265 RepID=B8IG87_METNO|nr:hypothetical protein Mnod_6806 [Methylobacterium nodulans ORS 2060]